MWAHTARHCSDIPNAALLRGTPWVSPACALRPHRHLSALTISRWHSVDLLVVIVLRNGTSCILPLSALLLVPARCLYPTFSPPVSLPSARHLAFAVLHALYALRMPLPASLRLRPGLRSVPASLRAPAQTCVAPRVLFRPGGGCALHRAASACAPLTPLPEPSVGRLLPRTPVVCANMTDGLRLEHRRR